ncbi:MAG: glycoside hydrolase family 3 C-terminal domain-containing protein [Bacteroidota bacterium]
MKHFYLIFRFTIRIAFFPFLLSCSFTNGPKITLDPSGQFVDSVLAGLTLDQKVSMLHGMGGGSSEFGDLDVRYFGIGGIRDKGIPPFYMGHGITGVRSGRDTTVHATYLTSPIAMGCSWDTALYREVAEVIAKEIRATGNDLVLGPTYNIIRHPLGGRNWESLSEDPFLTARMAVAFTQTIQENGVVCGPKHFVANNQETNRFDINNEVDERTLREIYLPAFKAAVTEGGALNIMGAYNRLNGAFMCQNKYLLDDILRKEWGFKGFVLSDFANGIRDTRQAVNAGMNLEMHRPKHYKDSLINLVKTGVIPESRVDTLLKDILSVMEKFDVFDRDRFEHEGTLHSPEHIALARKVAQHTPVLLKNKGVLPLKTKELKSVAIIGPNAKRFHDLPKDHGNYAYYLQGGGSGRTYYFHNAVIGPLTGIQNAIETKVGTTYAQGAKTPFAYQKNAVLPIDKEDEQLLAEAINIAKTSDAAILVVGLSGFNESEGWDRNTAKLPGQQDRLIKEVAKVNANTTVVLVAGSYVDVGAWIDDVEALVFVPYCGEQIGNGIADILTGVVNPSGKLPFTWVKDVDDYPKGSIFRGEAFETGGESNVYSEGIFVGYCWFDKKEIEVQYPFGYGLSYTDFRYSNLRIDASSFPVRVQLEITNSGTRPGAEVVQLYVSPRNPKIEKAPQELKGFDKVGLAPGETKVIEFLLDREDFAHYDVSNSPWAIESGTYEIRVGLHSRSQPLNDTVNLPFEIVN